MGGIYKSLGCIALALAIAACPEVDALDTAQCLTEPCAGGADCQGKVNDGWCYIDNTCYAEGQTIPGDVCMWCEPPKSQMIAVGKCGGGEVCNASGVCVSGDSITTDATPDVQPDPGPEVTPDTQIDAVEDVVPDAVEDVVSDAVEDVVPDAVADVVPDAIEDVVPDAVADVVPDAAADVVPDAVADVVPDAVPDVVPDAVPDAIADTVVACTPTCGECEECIGSVCTALADDTACADDGLACTSDLCSSGVCAHTTSGGCLIAGSCYAIDEIDPNDTCQACSAADTTGWTSTPDDCGAAECGSSPSGCYDCGSCAGLKTCVSAACVCPAGTVEDGNGTCAPESVNTALLLHMDGTDGTFVDSSSNNHPVSAVNGATQSATDVYFGSGAGVFSGGTWAPSQCVAGQLGASLAIPDHASLAFGTGDFTVDTWVRRTSKMNYTGIVQKGDYGQGGSWYWWFFDDNLLFGSGSSQGFATVPYPDDDSWHHVALTRSSATLRVFLDGTIGAQVNFPADITSTYPLEVGCHANNNGLPCCGMAGYLDEMRISTGVAVWESDFVLATLPYTPVP